MYNFKRVVFITAIFVMSVFLLTGALLAYSSDKSKGSQSKVPAAVKKVKTAKPQKPATGKSASSVKISKKKPRKTLPVKKVASRKIKRHSSSKGLVKRAIKKPRVSYSKSDLDLLARLITAEASAEPFNAKVAVGSVIINRIKSHTFANSIRSVIYEVSDGYYQFTPVLNGWINKPATADSKKAAYTALYGKDQSKGSLYYFDNTTKNTWLWSKPIKARIGNLVFAE